MNTISRNFYKASRLFFASSQRSGCCTCSFKPFSTIPKIKNAKLVESRQLSRFSTQNNAESVKEPETTLVSALKKAIHVQGPLSVAQFMRLSLTSDMGGYYQQGDVFGREGDFVTSPEVSQMMGELLAIWFITQWQSLGMLKEFRLVELGPGRGTLMADVLRTLKQFPQIYSCISSVDLVESSLHLRELQSKNIKRDGLTWYNYLEEVPEGLPCFYIAHEFFDAMPIHKFEMTDQGLRELLLDYDEDVTSPFHFKYVLSNGPTSAVIAYEKFEDLPTLEIGQRIEVSPDAATVAQVLAKRIEQDGGTALIIDYGKDEFSSNSFRGIRQHDFVDPLSNPGKVDLSVDVDFAAIKKAVSKFKVASHGPVTQREFLLQLGIQARAKKLVESTNDLEKQQQVYSEFLRLTSPKEMGDIYKMLCFTPVDAPTPVAFSK